MMRGIIISWILVALIDLSQQQRDNSNKQGWRLDAINFAAQVKASIRQDIPADPICSELREIVVSAREVEVLRNFSRCERMRNFDSMEDCYNESDQTFYHEVTEADTATFCENNITLCSLFDSEYRKISSSPAPCLYFRSSVALIEIWSRCSYMKDINDALGRIDILSKRPMIAALAEKVRTYSIAVDTARDGFDKCKNELSVFLDTRAERNSAECQGWVKLSTAQKEIQKCYHDVLDTLFESTKTLTRWFGQL